MANSLSPKKQGRTIWELIKKRPTRALMLLTIIAISVAANQKYDPIVIKYSADFGDPIRQIETLIFINPNTDKRDIELNLSPTGESYEFGMNEAHAADVSAKPLRIGKLGVLERSVSVVSILRTQLDHSSIRIPGPIDIQNGNSTMRRSAVAYLISLLLLFSGFVPAVSAFAGFLLLSRPSELPRRVSEMLK